MLTSIDEAKGPLSHLRVKICGIAIPEDARLAVEAGADALGFLVGLRYETADRLSPEKAQAIIAGLPPFVSSVLVTHLEVPAEVLAVCRIANPQVLQLHGGYPLEQIGVLRRELPHLKIVKAVHVSGEQAVETARMAARCADAVLLDSRTATRLGGTGITHDWSISRRIVEAVGDFPVILAGGLTPENVAAAVTQVQPFGVDVNTGVTSTPGRKSPLKLSRFIDHARQAARQARERSALAAAL